MLEISHDALGICSDQKLHDLLLRVRNLVPCENIIAFLGETDNHGTLKGVAKLVNAGYPAEWLGSYLENGYTAVDPVLNHAFQTVQTSTLVKNLPRGRVGRGTEFYRACRQLWADRRRHPGPARSYGDLGQPVSFAGVDMGEHPRHMAVLAYLTPHLHIALMRTAFAQSDSRSLLSAREREVLQWMIEGKTNWEASRILGISERTVKFHVKNILVKLQSSTRGQAIAHALEQKRVGGPLSSLETWLASVCSQIENFPNLGSRPPTLRQLAEVL